MPTEWDIGSDSPRNRVFTPPYFKAEAVRKSSRQLQVLLGKNHLLFVVETYHTFTFSSFVFSLYNSQAQSMSTAQRPPKSTTENCQDRMSHAFVPLALADGLLRSRWSSHARSSSTKMLGPGLLRARPTDDVDPSATDSFLKLILLLLSSIFFFFFRFLFFSSS